MEETVDVQSLLAKESLAMDEAQQVVQLAQASKAQREVFEQWIAQQSEELSSGQGNVGRQALALGLVLANAGRPAEAVEWLTKASAGVQKSLALGLCYLQTEQYEEALAELDRARQHGADQFTVAMNQAEALRQLGRLDEAEALLKKYDRKSPAPDAGQGSALITKTQADYWYQMGRIFEARDQREQALENYQKAVELQEDHQAANFRLGYYSDLAGDDESAIKHYIQATDTWPVHINALINLAVLHEDAEHYDQAEACLGKVLAANPNHERALLYLRDVLSTETMYYDEDQERLRDRRNQVLEIPVTDFELSVRSRNCLKSMGLNTLGDLLKVTEQDLLNYKNFGETSLREIKVILAQKGLYLGQMVEDKTAVLETDEESEVEEDQAASEQATNTPLSAVNFSIRVMRCLEDLGIATLGDVAKFTEEQLLESPNFGQTSLEEVKLILAENGLSLGGGS